MKSKYEDDGWVSCPGRSVKCPSDYSVCSPPNYDWKLHNRKAICCPWSHPNRVGNYCFAIGGKYYSPDFPEDHHFVSCPEQDYPCPNSAPVCYPPIYHPYFKWLQGCCPLGRPNHYGVGCCPIDDSGQGQWPETECDWFKFMG